VRTTAVKPGELAHVDLNLPRKPSEALSKRQTKAEQWKRFEKQKAPVLDWKTK
jgi:hypothetical protein